MAPVANENAPLTIRSTHRVSQLPIGRGTMSVPMTLATAVSTNSAPTTAAAERPMSGTTMRSPPRSMAVPNHRGQADGSRAHDGPHQPRQFLDNAIVQAALRSIQAQRQPHIEAVGYSELEVARDSPAPGTQRARTVPDAMTRL